VPPLPRPGATPSPSRLALRAGDPAELGIGL